MRPFAAAAACLLLAAAGCGKDPLPAGDDPLLVAVIDEATGSPVGGVELMLLDASTNRPLAGPVVSDAAGMAAMPGGKGGQPRLVVLGGALWATHSQPDWYASLRRAGGRPAAPEGLSAPAAPAITNRVLVRRRGSPGGAPRFSGTVVDARTGEPLAQAFVSLSPWPVGYGGGAAVSDDVTGPDGAFAVHDIPVAMIGDTGVGFQVVPLVVSRHGYRVAFFTHDPPGGIDTAEVPDLVIALEPLAADDNGGLEGRIVRGGEPVNGLVVALAPAGAKGAVGVAGQAAVTGADGRFRFAGLPAGDYLVHPGFLVGDGAWYGGGAPPVTVAAGATADAGDTAVLHELEPDPTSTGYLAAGDTLATFRCSVAPGAARYGWFLDGELLAETEHESVVVALPSLAAGLHAWEVSAIDAQRRPVGVMQVDAWFRRDVP